MLFNRNRVSAWYDGKVLEMAGVMVAQPGEFADCHWTGHSNMIKITNLMLCRFHQNKRKA